MRCACQVYPRGRGEAIPTRFPPTRWSGLSPRARGSHSDTLSADTVVRSIPAGAGKPGFRGLADRPAWVYPRGRGEAPGATYDVTEVGGLSPRARGSPPHAISATISSRSIPAGAGKPTRGVQRPNRGWVYPRGRGEATVKLVKSGRYLGLSPRARGSHIGQGVEDNRFGSIPAGAGKPPLPGRCSSGTGVYPRGRGEARPPSLCVPTPEGLSPRARGSQRPAYRDSKDTGSIPAGAGKPIRAARRRREARVYPRGRGEARQTRIDRDCSTGLSPRARGSPDEGDPRAMLPGSIPAGAGEAASIMCCSSITSGLSPRARGSQ